MTYFADLSPYVYLPETLPSGVTALNVGWLSPMRDYPRGDVPEGFTDALGLLCRDEQRAVTRGMHACGLIHRLGEQRFPIRIEGDGRTVVLGTAEVRVVSRAGEWLIAPTLVYHYVTRHHYLPPEPFVEAVLARRTPATIGSAPG
ncbi:hypothetical protein RM780_00900 [Streptomyces sp. DSM 44917]|uniref:DUF7919 domain-containing protein n=1 Tax=Streptomyces boetiae TaxID=3075541 RepID=A0ABU2L1T3_9ACTN|nr:hypothetical protein [Streptomyces sp. DSM 44917]MDT0305524.1 hypothetical protein [Streptomyces sp. DSM 44917]